jgi:hypothetical protein
VAWRALGFSSWPYSGPLMARKGAPASGLAKPLVENVITTVILAAQGLPGRLRCQAHVVLAWAPGPRPRSRVPLLSRGFSPAPGSPTGIIPRKWLVCARPAAPDGTQVGRTESADAISYEIAENDTR